ncbi:Metabotropic X receptor [Paragonimus heterotremus]|uniref:Metabotropic X receptor n=1 Tax=Paragonimus heterotremus TaxID=100268 RepID=A0A8J4WIF2_9TREM|nr:Metabotropic X receptor [Paragonimus heterotremus]
MSVSISLKVLFMMDLAVLAIVVVNSFQYNGDRIGCEGINADPFIYEGQVMLGVFVPINESPSFKPASVNNTVVRKLGFKFLEAILSTLDKVNERKNYLDYRLGAIVYDTCHDAEIAVRQSLKFIGSYSPFGYQSDSTCLIKNSIKVNTPVMAVVGPAFSGVSIEVASLLKLFSMPQVSYYASNEKLSNLKRFPTFFRTVPSINETVAAIVLILQRYHWTYINLITDDSEYGESTYGVLFEQLSGTEEHVCIDVTVFLRESPSEPGEVNSRMLKLTESRARVNVLLCNVNLASEALEVVRSWDESLRNRFLWIFTNMLVGSLPFLHPTYPVDSSDYSKQYNFPIIAHILLIVPKTAKSDEILQYRLRLDRPYGKKTWRESFLMSTCNCIPNGTQPVWNASLLCTEEQQKWCTEQLNGNSLFYVPNTVNSVLAVSEALKKMQDAGCRYCQPNGSEESRATLLSFLRNSSFNGFGNETFQFAENGGAQPEFTVLAYFHEENVWSVFAEYDAHRTDRLYDINESTVRHVLQAHPHSFCSDPCFVGQAKQFLPHSACCWDCKNCSKFQIVVNATECLDCPPGFAPNSNSTSCDPVSLEYMSAAKHEAVAFVILSSIAISLWCLTFGIYVKNWNTPVIKASGRETTMVLFVGTLLAYCSPIILLTPGPSIAVCSWAAISPGLCSVICYAAIYVRINRIDRVFQLNNISANAPKKFISPKSQLLFMGIICASEVILLAVTLSVWRPVVTWMFAGPKSYSFREANRIMMVVENLDYNRIICFSTMSLPQFSGMFLPICLMFFSLFHAYKIRKVPYGYNEARSLGLVNYVNAILIALVVILITFVQLQYIELLPLSGFLLTMATNLLVVLVWPKIYTVLFRPEINTNAGVLQRHRTHSQLETILLLNEFEEPNSGRPFTMNDSLRHSMQGLQELTTTVLSRLANETDDNLSVRERAASLACNYTGSRSDIEYRLKSVRRYRSEEFSGVNDDERGGKSKGKAVSFRMQDCEPIQPSQDTSRRSSSMLFDENAIIPPSCERVNDDVIISGNESNLCEFDAETATPAIF